MKYFIQGFPGGSDGKESACNAEDLGSSPGLGRFLGEVNGYPLYYAFLENSINFCPKNIHHHLADVEFFFFHTLPGLKRLLRTTLTFHASALQMLT